MHRLVSRDTRTVASKGIWKAVLMYCVRMVGMSCLLSMACITSMTRSRHSFRSSSLLPFLFGVFFIVGGLAAASFGYLNPIIAAVLHNVGSLIVVFNSARLVRQGEELEPFLKAETEAGTAAPVAPSTFQPA